LSELSIFIDESGDFGSQSEHYLVSLVFHEQSKDIAEPLRYLEKHLLEIIR